MRKILEDFCNDEKRSNGLLLIDMPTGTGKTYKVAEYIANNYEKIKGKIFFVTQLKKNLPEHDIRECFKKIGKEQEVDEVLLRVENNVDNLCSNFHSVSQELRNYIGDNLLLSKIEREINLINGGRNVNEENMFLVQQARDDLQNELERELRNKVTAYLTYDENGKERTVSQKKDLLESDEEYKWITRLYPTTQTYKKKIFIMSLDKFLYRYSTIIEPPFNLFESDLLKNGIVFMDEFDGTKDVILNKIIKDGLEDKKAIIDKPSDRKENSPSTVNDEPKSKVKHTTYKEIFNDLYDKYLYLKPKERKQAIYTDMKPLFHSETDLQIFIDENCFRRWRNLIVRRQRFARKAYNQHFQYFATFTYADGKHSEESFKKRLLETLRRLASRHNWRYMGVWERGKETDRLHFHALLYIPDGEMIGKFEEVTDYNKKTGKQKTFTQNTFFAEKFGRNEFDVISDRDISYGKAIAYIMKYMEKQNTRAVYSRGLYEHFRSDIMGSDVICKMGISDETDNRLILAQDFMCIDEGVLIGKVSKETIEKMPKCV